MVLRRCRQMLREEDAALDALQDVFARALEQALPVPEYPSSFLYTMATHICIDKLRSTHNRLGGGEPLLDALATSGDIEQQSFARRMLDRIFRRHGESTRVIAVMHYVDGMTYEEVAAQVNLTSAGVRRRLQTLRANVAKSANMGIARDAGVWKALIGKESI